MRRFRPYDEHPALFGINAELIAEYCQVHLTTARRWKRGEDPPYAAIQWITACTQKDLGLLDPAFSGWRLRDGKLISPEDEAVSPGDIRALPFQRRLIAHYQTEQRFSSQADWVDECWVPARRHEAVNEA